MKKGFLSHIKLTNKKEHLGIPLLLPIFKMIPKIHRLKYNQYTFMLFYVVHHKS